MKKIIVLAILSTFVMSFLVITPTAEARSGSYYKSASSGRFTTKSYSSSHKSTTYKSYYR